MDSPQGMCWACGNEEVRQCPKCDLARYCTEECQLKDRVRHFEECISATKREQLCSFCGKVLDEEALTCSICRAVFYCDRECERPHEAIHSTVCGHTKGKILQMTQTIRKWNRKIKNTPQYIGRLVHAMDFLRWSENEGKTTNSSFHGPVSLMIFGADLKHILFTLSQLSEEFQAAVTFTMLDASPHLLSRNILLLFLLRKAFERASQTEELIRRTLFIYYSLRLDFASFFFLCRSLETLRGWTYSKFSEEMQNTVNVSKETFFQIQSIWNGWLTFSRAPDVLQKLEMVRNLKLRRLEVQRVVERVKQVISKELESDFCHWLSQGSFKLKDKNVYGNVTLACFNPFHKHYLEMYSDIDAPSCDDSTRLKLETEDIMIYSPYGTDLIFQDWDYYEVSKGQTKKDNVLEMYQDYIKTIMTRAGECIAFKNVKLNFELTKPSANTMEASVPNGIYDRICTGLLADIIGLPKLLNMTGPFLNNKNPHACVITHHRLWSTFIEMKDMAALKKEWLCNNSLQAPIDPITTVATKWATFRQFLQAELLCYQHELEYSQAKCGHIPSWNEISEMNGLRMSDFLLRANSIFPFRFRVNKRYISMTDNKLYTLEWKSIPVSLPCHEKTLSSSKKRENNYGMFKPTSPFPDSLNLNESIEVDSDLQSGKEVLGKNPACFGLSSTGKNNLNSRSFKEEGLPNTGKNTLQTMNPLVVTGRINDAQKSVSQLDRTSLPFLRKFRYRNEPYQTNKNNGNNILNHSSKVERSSLQSSMTEDKKLVKNLISSFSKQEESPELYDASSFKHQSTSSDLSKETLNAVTHGHQNMNDTFDNSRLKIFKRNQELKRNFLRQSFPQPSKEGTKLSSNNASTFRRSWHETLTKSKPKSVINSSNKSINFNEYEETKRCSAYRGQSSKFPGNSGSLCYGSCPDSVKIPKTAHQIRSLICAFEKSINTNLSTNKSQLTPKYSVCSQIPSKNPRLPSNNLLNDSKAHYHSISKSKSMTEMNHNSKFQTDKRTYESNPKLYKDIVYSNTETKTSLRNKLPKSSSSSLDLKSTSKLAEKKSRFMFGVHLKKKEATSDRKEMVDANDKSEFTDQAKVDFSLDTDFEVKQNRNTGSCRETMEQSSKLRDMPAPEVNLKPRPCSYPMAKINRTPDSLNVQSYSAAYSVDKKDALPRPQKRVIEIASHYEKRINALQLSTSDDHDPQYLKTITDSSNANDGKNSFSKRKGVSNDDCKSNEKYSELNPSSSGLKKLNFATIDTAKVMNLKPAAINRSVQEVRKQPQQRNKCNKILEWNLKSEFPNVVDSEIASNNAEFHENITFQNNPTLDQVSASTVISPYSCIKQENSYTSEGAPNLESRICQLDLSNNCKYPELGNNKPNSLTRNNSLKYTNKILWKPKMSISERTVSKDLTKPVTEKNSFKYVRTSSCDNQEVSFPLKQIKLEDARVHLGSTARNNLSTKPMTGTPSVEVVAANEESNYDTENDSGIKHSEIEVDEAVEAVEAFELEISQDSFALGNKSSDGDDDRNITLFKSDDEANLASQSLPSNIETETSKARLKNLFDSILGRSPPSSSNSKSHAYVSRKEQIFELSAQELPEPLCSMDEVNTEESENLVNSAKSLGIPSVLKRDGSARSERKTLRVSWGDLPQNSSDNSLSSTNEQDKTKRVNDKEEEEEEEAESQDEEEETRSFEDEEKFLYFLESFEQDDDLDFKASSL